MEEITQIDENLIKQIRMHINMIENQNFLIQNKETWNRLCTSLDVIDDSTGAVRYYLNSDYPEESDGKYLFTYGLLQAIFLQQDAINHIYKSLFQKEIIYKDEYPELSKIREIRNDVVGHPTEKKRNSMIYFNNIIQHSLEKFSFEYLIYSGNVECKHETIYICELINTQNRNINEILLSITERQNMEFEEYINNHKDVKLEELFKPLQYKREKLLASSTPMHIHSKASYLNDIINIINNCKQELNKRYVSWEQINIGDTIKDIDEILNLLIHELPSSLAASNTLIEKHLTHHLFCKIDELIMFCMKTDRFFANDGKDDYEKDNEKINKITFQFIDDYEK